MTEKQIMRVLNAVMEGADNAPEIGEMTGLPPCAVASYLNELGKVGVIRKTGRTRKGIRGHNLLCWELTESDD